MKKEFNLDDFPVTKTVAEAYEKSGYEDIPKDIAAKFKQLFAFARTDEALTGGIELGLEVFSTHPDERIREMAAKIGFLWKQTDPDNNIASDFIDRAAR